MRFHSFILKSHKFNVLVNIRGNFPREPANRTRHVIEPCADFTSYESRIVQRSRISLTDSDEFRVSTSIRRAEFGNGQSSRGAESIVSIVISPSFRYSRSLSVTSCFDVSRNVAVS